MSFESGETPKDSKLSEYISDCYQKDIKILPSDINESGKGFTAVEGKIRYGLKSIKGVGGKGLSEIIEYQPYSSLEDMFNKVDRRRVNKTTFEALIKSGAFDSICGKNRKKTLQDYKQLKKYGASRQTLFEIEKKTSKDDIIKMELETLNMSITYPSEWSTIKSGNKIKLTGEILNVNEIYTKNKNKMCFAKLQTKKENIKMVVFPQVYKRFKDRLVKGNKVNVIGEKSDDNSLLLSGVKVVS